MAKIVMAMEAFFIFLSLLSYTSANRIIGGQDAAEGQFPSMALQMKGGSFFCGATIISQHSVLSAAHCELTNFMRHQIVAGTTTKSTGGIVKDVIQRILHPLYNSDTFENDIMILRVQTPFKFDDERFALEIAPIATVRPATGTPITVAGWGDTNINSIGQTFPDRLQYAEVTVIADEVCNSTNSYNGIIYPGMICIGAMEGGTDSCQGDSGGPTYVSGTNTVAGITSWGYGCAVENFPGVYTDVAFYQGWIMGYISNE